jgi:hypothetical protein
MLKRKFILIAFLILTAWTAIAQDIPSGDTIPVSIDDELAIDTSLDYDDLLDDFMSFIDSLLAPRSYLLFNVSGTASYFNYKATANSITTKRQLVISPTIGYYDKSGPGITFSANHTDYGQKRKWYQFSLTPSFDFIKNINRIGGFSYTRYFTRKSLPFYTTPLQNELNGYYIWRKPWLQTGLAVSYGWGSKKDVEERKEVIRRLLFRRGIIVNGTTTEESIRDFSIVASFRHSFYWISVLSKKDYFKFTPLLTIAAGTQKYGFNQTTSTYAVTARNNYVKLFNSGNVNLDDQIKFQALSATFYLRPEYNIGKFFIQPQLIFDYYFPAPDKRLSTFFSLNTGFMF